MSELNSDMGRWYKHGRALLDEIKGSSPQEGEAYVWYAGQHGFIVNLGGKICYFDVILNDFLDKNGMSRRVYPHPFNPEDAQRVDFVFCTHNHGDHLNLNTLLPLSKNNSETRFIVPAPHRGILTEAGIDENRVLAARGGQEMSLSPALSLLPLPAIHTRFIQNDGDKDENGDYLALGFILRGQGLSIYHSGDTWAAPSLVKALKDNSPLDLAMLPINGTDWERTASNWVGNMSALDAAKLARDIPIDLVIPSHYDMMAYNSENPARFADYMYSLCPQKRFHICALGERFIYKK